MPRTTPPTLRLDETGELWPTVPMLSEPRFSQSLERGLAILSCFTPDSPVQGIADLADMLGMSRSTTHRYVITLVALGYLEQVKEGRKYRLALSVIDLGMRAMNSMSLREHARPLLGELRQRTGYTTSLTVLDGPEILYLDRLPGARRGQRKIDLGLTIGARLPLHCTAMGKLMLAYLYDDAQRTLMDELTLSKRGPNTIGSKKALKTELATIREAGLAINDEALAPDLIAIAVPVRCESHEVVAAINLAANKTIIGIEQLVAALAPHLISTADRISGRLGYRREDEPHGPVSRPYNLETAEGERP
jgi:IclR family transcriptional regulator, pca regulon regulatory protein